MLNVIDLSIEYLRFDKEYTPYKLFGITITKRIFVGFISILGYIIGYAVYYNAIYKNTIYTVIKIWYLYLIEMYYCIFNIKF